jgi:hypothetical protein
VALARIHEAHVHDASATIERLEQLIFELWRA